MSDAAVMHLARDEWPPGFWDSWDALNDRDVGSHPLLQARFVRPLTEYFSAGVSALIEKGPDSITGILLLSGASRWWGGVRTGFLPSQAQIALLQGGLNPPAFLRSCHRALPLHAVRLDLLAVDSRYQAALLSSPLVTAALRGVDMSISLAGDFQSYWAARSRNLRKNISRYRNRIARETDGVEFRVLTDPADVELGVARYGFLESRGWKGEAGTAIHPGNTQGHFYRDALVDFSRTGNATVFELWQRNRLLASRLCIDNGETLVILKTTFDEDTRQLAPGRVLLHELLEHLFSSRRASRIEFYTNASKEQLDWSTDSRKTFNLSHYRHRAIMPTGQAVNP